VQLQEIDFVAFDNNPEAGPADKETLNTGNKA